MGDGGAEGYHTIGDVGQAAISLAPDLNDRDSGSLLDLILYNILKRQSSDA